MYKILIADDEQIVREGMRKLIDWNALGLELVGDAEDGKEAYDMIKKFKPDIAMIDINMPQIDGLKLCKIIKEEEMIDGSAAIVINGHWNNNSRNSNCGWHLSISNVVNRF